MRLAVAREVVVAAFDVGIAVTIIVKVVGALGVYRVVGEDKRKRCTAGDEDEERQDPQHEVHANVGAWVNGPVDGVADGESGEFGDLPQNRDQGLGGRKVSKKT